MKNLYLDEPELFFRRIEQASVKNGKLFCKVAAITIILRLYPCTQHHHKHVKEMDILSIKSALVKGYNKIVESSRASKKSVKKKLCVLCY